MAATQEPTQEKKEEFLLTRIAEVHRFIYDVDQIRRFVEIIGTKDAVHQIFVSARPKYNKEVKFRNRHISPRSFFDASPEHFIDLVRKYELPVGSYKDGDQVLPNNCLVLYCTTNARNGKRAAQNFVQECLT